MATNFVLGCKPAQDVVLCPRGRVSSAADDQLNTGCRTWQCCSGLHLAAGFTACTQRLPIVQGGSATVYAHHGSAALPVGKLKHNRDVFRTKSLAACGKALVCSAAVLPYWQFLYSIPVVSMHALRAKECNGPRLRFIQLHMCSHSRLITSHN